MGKYSLDITSKNNPFINIEVENDSILRMEISMYH